MVVIEKYEAMIDAISQYVDAEIAEHSANCDVEDIVDDHLYVMSGKQLKATILGEDVAFDVFIVTNGWDL